MNHAMSHSDLANLLNQSSGQPLTSPRKTSVVVCKSRQELQAYQPQLQELFDNAIDANIFYAPGMLLAALTAYGQSQSLSIVLVFAEQFDTKELIGVFPLSYQRFYRGIPLGVFSLWQHPQCFYTAPLLRRNDEVLAWSGLWDFVRHRRANVGLFLADLFPADGLVWRSLQESCIGHKHRVYALATFTRAMLCTGENAAEYIESTLSKKSLKELRRLRKRLAEMGDLRSSSWNANENLKTWINDFLVLEAKGWKGASGTALQLSNAERQYFEEIIHSAMQCQQLQLLKLSLNGEPIAMKCNFITRTGGFAFKIAFDEAYSKFSPGVQLELDNIHECHTFGSDFCMDSCAVSNHFMINRLWKDRRQLTTVLCSTGNPMGSLFLRCLPTIHNFRKRWKGSNRNNPMGANS